MYRNPKHTADSTEFANFITNLSDLYSKILLENPYMTIFTGDFNAQSDQWWFDGGSNNQGTQLNILFSELGLSQLISEPTHFRDHCNPTCIDLIICDQPNLVFDSGVRSSLDESCKHQLTFCKFVTKIPKIPPTRRVIWQYQKAKPDLIQRAMKSLDWNVYLSNKTPDAQVKCLNETILNIMKNFVPSSSISSHSDEPR